MTGKKPLQRYPQRRRYSDNLEIPREAGARFDPRNGRPINLDAPHRQPSSQVLLADLVS